MPNTREISVGRADDNVVCIDDSSVSRYQVTFMFADNWQVCDGLNSVDKKQKSTNGTWFRPNGEFALFVKGSFRSSSMICSYEVKEG